MHDPLVATLTRLESKQLSRCKTLPGNVWLLWKEFNDTKLVSMNG